MSAAAALATEAPATVTMPELEELCRRVRARVSWEVNHVHDDRPSVFHTLQERLHRVGLGVDMLNRPRFGADGQRALRAEFAHDLQGLLDVPPERLRQLVLNHCTSPNGQSHDHEAQRAAEQATAARNAMALPRVQPAELVAAFAARGVIVQAVDGNLHVSPADALTAADRDVLTLHKPAILAALARPAAVV